MGDCPELEKPGFCIPSEHVCVFGFFKLDLSGDWVADSIVESFETDVKVVFTDTVLPFDERP